MPTDHQGDPSGPPRCLLITKEFSSTPTSGGTLRTLALLEQLATHYLTTVISPDGVLVQGPGQPLSQVPGPAAESSASESSVSTRSSAPAEPSALVAAGHWRRLATIGTYRSISGVRTAGDRLLDNLRRGAQGRYQAAVIDHTCLAGLADAVAQGCDRLVISMHNIESDLMAQRAAAATSRPSRLVMQAETRLLRRLEAHVVQRYPVVVCTEADARELDARELGAGELGAGPGAVVCRNGIFPAEATSGGARPPHSMVFSGALDWEPNVAGLLWFADRVWPQVRARFPQATVTIAGRNPGPAVVEACSAPGLRLLANPPVMAPVLDAHALGIVPLLNGGGSRIKILEYLAVGLDVVSTDVGASGLEDIPDHLLDRLPVDPDAFAEGLSDRLANPRDTSAPAQDWVRKNYAWDVTLQPLLDVLVS